MNQKEAERPENSRRLGFIEKTAMNVDQYVLPVHLNQQSYLENIPQRKLNTY